MGLVGVDMKFLKYFGGDAGGGKFFEGDGSGGRSTSDGTEVSDDCPYFKTTSNLKSW